MKVLLFNGSPHKDGCIFTALSEVAKALKEEGIDSEMLHIGVKPVRGCIACNKCMENPGAGCVFRDPVYDEFIEKAAECDGIVIGAPVYYAGPAGSLCAFLDRAFYSAGERLKGKPGACVVNCRRGGASASFDRLNKYFTINQMPVVSSQYWNSTHGFTPDDVRRDLEGLQTMRTLGRNMAYLLKTAAAAGIPRPETEPWIATSFMDFEYPRSPTDH